MHRPEIPFLKNLYEAEQNSGKILMIFAILAIVIASIGHFGLAAYTTLQRKKEIGIRKVMGSSIPGIIRLLSRDFGKLILISFILAIPLTYFVMAEWLNGFAYKLNFLSVFPVAILISGFLAFLIAFITVSYHSVKAAISNPVDSLHCE